MSLKEAISLAQQPVPQLALQHHLGMRPQLGPKAFQHAARPPEAQAASTELALDGHRIGSQIVAIRERRLQPCQQRLRLRRIGRVPADLDERALAQFLGDEGGAVDRDAEKPAPGLPFPFGQIIRQPGKHIGEFLAQIALELEHHRAEQCVGAAVDLGQPHLMIDLMISDAEAVAQYIGEVGTHRLVPWPIREVRDDLGKVLLPPGAEHGGEHRAHDRPISRLSSLW
jgi:hypothetical protein